MRPHRCLAIGLVMLTACARAAPAPDPTWPAEEVPPDAIGSHVEALDEIAGAHGGTRAAGTPGYDASVDYVVGELEAAGLEVERQAFEYPSFEQIEPALVSVAGGSAFEGDDLVKSMLYGASGSATGPLVEVTDGCAPDAFGDLPDQAIVLVPSGDCFRRDQLLGAQEAGAAAFIGAYPAWSRGQIGRPTLIEPRGVEIPAVAVGGDLATALAEALEESGSVPPAVTVAVVTRTEQRESSNVIATFGEPSPDAIIVGAHLDSVIDGPGINDNASGVAAVLEIADAVAARGAPGGLRFALWGAEEFGSHGSRAYVGSLDEDARDDVEAYINLDMVGSPNGGRYVYDDSLAPPDSERIGAALSQGFDRLGLSWRTVDMGGRSDHAPFMGAGIPVGGVFSGASAPLSSDDAELFGGEAGTPMDACYHLPCDRADNVAIATAAEMADAVLLALESLADE